MLSDDWRPAGTLIWEGDTRNVLPLTLQMRFTSRIIRTEASTPGAPLNWRRAGYLRQVNDVGSGEYELASVTVPLNTVKLFAFPLLYDSYQLIFTPVKWLPSLSLRFWEYTGAEDTALLNELPFMR